MSVSDPVLSAYEWLVVMGAFGAFLFGYGTGSNDVANAFGTSVGAKTLTLRQAVVIAALFEFTGAMVLGRVSTSVISGGIADVNQFASQPEMLAYGMMIALFVSAFWNIFASYLEMNVSSTHSIIGSIIGFSLIYAGGDGVIWQAPSPSSFPPYTGVVPIVVSWFFSPIFTAIASFVFFFTIRFLVLRRKNAYHLAFWLLPPLVTITVFICIFFVFTKGAKKTFQADGDDWTDAKSAWVAAIIGAGMGVLVAVIILPILKYRAGKRFNEDGTLKADEPTPAQDAEEGLKDEAALKEGADKVPSETTESQDSYQNLPKWKQYMKKTGHFLYYIATHGTTVDIHAVVDEDPLVHNIHQNAEVFDPKAEYALQYLQVFSAICVVFAHGAGEVGYMAGPLATIWYVYTEGAVTKSVKAPVWVVFIGAFGLVIGLATYGYNVTRAMGVRLAKLSPSRGFCAELATATVIMIASQYGLPTSSSQCITGGIIGVGLMEGVLKGVNWQFFAKQFASWVSTLFVAGILTAAIFAQGVYAPSLISGTSQVQYEQSISAISTAMVKQYQTVLLSYQSAAAAGALPGLTTAQLQSYNKSAAAIVSGATANAKAGTVSVNTVISNLNQALSLYQANTVLTVGQLSIQPKALVCNNNVTADIQAGRATFACPAAPLLAPGVPVTWPAPVPAAKRRQA